MKVEGSETGEGVKGEGGKEGGGGESGEGGGTESVPLEPARAMSEDEAVISKEMTGK